MYEPAVGVSWNIGVTVRIPAPVPPWEPIPIIDGDLFRRYSHQQEEPIPIIDENLFRRYS